MTPSSPSAEPERRAELGYRSLREIHARGDRLMTVVVLAHTLLALAMAPAYGTWFVTLTVAPLAASMFLVARFVAPGTLLTRSLAGVALQTFCALHIYQYHGLAEQHFWFFTATTAMIVYQDVLALWPGVLLIVAQHVLFATLHNSGVELYFFEQSYVGNAKLGFHFGIALVQTALASIIAHGLKRRTLAELDLRHHLETARRSAEEAMAARTMFLASISHEIRTPMNGIQGMADVLLYGRLSDDQRECVETIQSSSRALLGVVGDVLDFTRIETGRIELERITYDPLELAVQVGRLLRPRAFESQTSIDVEWSRRPPRTALGDPNRVRQVLLNLVGNAAKFARSGHVRVRLWPDVGAGGGRELVFEVVDDGIGIAPEALARIFEPFEQADRSTTRRFGGTGLGLAITRRLVDLMGGRLEVESEVGSGSTFRVRLPLEADVECEPHSRAATAPLEGRVVSIPEGFCAAAARSTIEGLGAVVTINEGEAAIRVACVERGEVTAVPDGSVLLLGSAARLAEGVPTNERLLLRPFLPEELERALCAAAGVDCEGRPGASREPERPFEGREVLVVEDNPVNRRVARRLLELLGIEASFAADGRLGLARLEERAFDLVLMDCQMPELNGYQATRAWREIEARRGLARTPILALTASAVEGERERCLEVGMDDCLTKPVALEVLHRALSEHLATARRAV